MTRKQLAGNSGVNNALITQKFQQKKKLNKFFKSLMISIVKFNNLEAINR